MVQFALVAENLLRGFGVPMSKSLPLLSVSVQPPFLRIAAVVALVFGVVLVSEQFAVVP